MNSNPCAPYRDTAREYVWRGVPVVADGRAMIVEFEKMSAAGFEFASTSEWTAGVNGAVHQFRRLNSTMLDMERNCEKLELQAKALTLKLECDRLQIELAKVAKERNEAVATLARDGITF